MAALSDPVIPGPDGIMSWSATFATACIIVLDLVAKVVYGFIAIGGHPEGDGCRPRAGSNHAKHARRLFGPARRGAAGLGPVCIRRPPAKPGARFQEAGATLPGCGALSGLAPMDGRSERFSGFYR